MAKKKVGAHRGRVSSPSATGGAGVHFEEHVDAAFLTLLLLRGIPPVLTDCVVTEVHLQAEHLGWATDDAIVVGTNGSGMQRRLFCQAKLSFTVSASNDECRKAFGDFWSDFKTNTDFSPDKDRFAIVVQRATDMLLHHFVSLLDCARSSRDGADFDRRLNIPGFLNAAALRYAGEIQEIIGDIEGRAMSAGELWPFLKLLHLLPMDLHSSTRQTEAAMKTMLALVPTTSDPNGTAKATWADLLAEASEGKIHGKSYRYEDLPKDVRDRHPPIAYSNHQVLQRLVEHSVVILEGIRTAIGPSFRLRRDQLVQSLLEKLEETQVILVAGPAGSGKSAVAKAAVAQLSDDFTFSFRAVEFATIHLDESLQRIQIPATATSIRAVLAGQARKVLLVESVERLLEATTRDAFADLLQLVKSDPTWRLVMTCREYSAEVVRSSLLQFAGLGHSVVAVPPLTDDELDAVATSLPALARPLADARLRRLLRNPYLLDKASQMDWADAGPLPDDEHALRAKFWREIVRAEHEPAGDMPRRRETTLSAIALRRARALTQYVSRTDLDGEAVHALRRDSLLSFSADSDLLAAPAHDVLEDWAILRWIDEQFATCEGALPQLAEIIGPHAAIRRTYRKWVAEKVDHDPDAADRMMNGVCVESSLPGHFRDDTLVSLLQSPTSRDLLERHSALLFATGHKLLHRVMHLVRVACVKAPAWLPPQAAGAVVSVMHVPDGIVWEIVLGLIASHVDVCDRSELPLILGFIEDAARGISWQTPYPPGAQAIADIAYWILPQFESYRSEAQRRRVLQIIARLPNCNPAGFRKLLVGEPDAEPTQRAEEELRDIILWGMEGMPASRDTPDLVMEALRDDLILTTENLQRHRYSGGLELEPAFGLRERAHFHSFPASAFHGPFLHLLRQHSRQAIEFITTLFNHSANWYAGQRVPMNYVEPPFEITLTLPDGAIVKQWANGRLWNLYRGTTVGPYVLQSVLMALEQWLLGLGQMVPDRLDDLLCGIVHRSTNAAVTAVVASVATAFPHACPETLLMLLSSRDCILLDRGRLAVEDQAAFISGMLPGRDAEQRVYCKERQDANSLPHRKHDLESAIVNLQLGPHRDRVQQRIDGHRRSMAPVEQQTELDRIWRLALHRMDLREYTVAEQQEEQSPLLSEQTGAKIRLELNKADPDVQRMADDTAAEFAAMNQRVGSLMWGMKILARESGHSYDPSEWRSRLKEARGFGTDAADPRESQPGDGGAIFVAAVCVRDHFDELSEEEVEWCVEMMSDAIEATANAWHHVERVQRYSMGGDRAAASVIASLAVRSLNEGLKERVRAALACAVLHPINEVRVFAASGIGQDLWKKEPALATRCINVLATESRLVQKRWQVERRRPFDDRLDHNEIERDVALALRGQFYSDLDEQAYERLDITEHSGSQANVLILSILARVPHDDRAIEAFRRLAGVLVAWWDSDESRRGHRDRSFEVDGALAGLLEEFVLRVDGREGERILEPILDAVATHPRRVSDILQGIIGVEDRMPQTEQFWRLWELFAAKVRTAPWLRHIDRQHADGVEMIDVIFLTRWWKDGVEHWRSVEGHASSIHRLFHELPMSARVLDDYVRFLYHIGRKSLPAALVGIAKALKGGDAQRLLRMDNTPFMLETLLGVYVYGRPSELKRDRDVRESVLLLLDALVERGSSAAYKMRDDFVTPSVED